jgi:hypothetical protein
VIDAFYVTVGQTDVYVLLPFFFSFPFFDLTLAAGSPSSVEFGSSAVDSVEPPSFFMMLHQKMCLSLYLSRILQIKCQHPLPFTSMREGYSHDRDIPVFLIRVKFHFFTVSVDDASRDSENLQLSCDTASFVLLRSLPPLFRCYSLIPNTLTFFTFFIGFA